MPAKGLNTQTFFRGSIDAIPLSIVLGSGQTSEVGPPWGHEATRVRSPITSFVRVSAQTGFDTPSTALTTFLPLMLKQTERKLQLCSYHVGQFAEGPRPACGQ